MKIKTVIESRVPDKKRSTTDKLLLAVLVVTNMFLTQFMPFAFGFYFAYTQNMIWLLLMLLLLILTPEINYEGDKIKLRIKRFL